MHLTCTYIYININPDFSPAKKGRVSILMLIILIWKAFTGGSCILRVDISCCCSYCRSCALCDSIYRRLLHVACWYLVLLQLSQTLRFVWWFQSKPRFILPKTTVWRSLHQSPLLQTLIHAIFAPNKITCGTRCRRCGHSERIFTHTQNTL